MLFPAAVAGSLPKPFWLSETHKLWPLWKAMGKELELAKRDATLLWIKHQEDAGLDTIGDGEQSRQHFVHGRSEEHTSELQSLMRISYAVFCLKKKNKTNN